MSFEKALREPRGGRIHDLVVEEFSGLEADVVFDVTKEIGEEGWKKMVEFFRDRDPKTNRTGSALSMASDMKIVDPVKFSNIQPEIDTLMTDAFVNKYFHKSEPIDCEIFFILCPEMARRWYATGEAGVLERRLDRSQEAQNHQSIIGTAYRIKLIAPESLPPVFRSDSIPPIEIRQYFDRLRDSENLRSFAHIAARIKVLFPEFQFDIPWDSLKKIFAISRTECVGSRVVDLSFSSLAANMKILAAKEVYVTDHGLEFVMPEKQTHREKISKRPERQQF